MRISRDQIIERYKAESANLTGDERRNLLRELLQEVILCHMKEVGLFEDMAFHGGTSLRLLHRIDRFSEDLDMSLIEADPDFDLAEKMELLKASLTKQRIDLEFQNKIKPGNPIQKFFLNDTYFLNEFKDTIGTVSSGEKLKIKLELDVEPPEHQAFLNLEIKSSFSAMIKAHDLETCMGQKIHAVLCRGQSYGMDIVKGRDLYDLEWYLTKKISPNLKNLSACLNRMGPWKDKGLFVDTNWILMEVPISLKTKKFDAILADVRPLISATEYQRVSKSWELKYFTDLLAALV